MRFDERFLDEVKSRLKLSDVIGRSVKLRRAGREWVGLSPFSKEKTPSFYVNDEKGFYHDFSSGKHGDLLSFLQETERLSFPEAVERLAAEAGVPMPSPDPKDQAAEKVRQGLGDFLELAARWFEAELRRPTGAAARAYLEGRALPEAEWGRFRLGYAPAGRTALKDYLIAKGARPADLIACGVAIAPEDGGAPYDRFRDRIIFPITDVRGRVISFGGRALDPQAKAKYLNGPESPLFHKGATLYGLFEAKKLLLLAEREAPTGPRPSLAVVEGYMDVIACQRAGVAAVAPLGTALTEDQIDALWRLHPEPTLCFDGDGAGQRAASRAMDRALPKLRPGKSFAFAVPSGGKDPDDVLREQGAAALKAQLAATRPFVQQLFEREAAREPLDTPERRAGLKARLRALSQEIADKDVASAYRDDLLARLEASAPRATPVRPWSAEPRPQRGRGGFDPRPAYPTTATLQARAAAENLPKKLRLIPAAVAWYGVLHPDALDPYIEALMEVGFHDRALDLLAKGIGDAFVDPVGLDTERLTGHLASSGLGDLLVSLEKAARESKAPFLDSEGPPVEARRIWSRAFDALIELAQVEAALAAAKEDMARTLDATHQRMLRSRQMVLERALSDGSLFAEPEA